MVQVKYGMGNTVFVGSCVSEMCMSIRVGTNERNIILAVKLQIAVFPTSFCRNYMHILASKFRLLACEFCNLVSQIKERTHTEDVRE